MYGEGDSRFYIYEGFSARNTPEEKEATKLGVHRSDGPKKKKNTNTTLINRANSCAIYFIK